MALKEGPRCPPAARSVQTVLACGPVSQARPGEQREPRWPSAIATGRPPLARHSPHLHLLGQQLLLLGLGRLPPGSAPALLRRYEPVLYAGKHLVWVRFRRLWRGLPLRRSCFGLQRPSGLSRAPLACWQPRHQRAAGEGRPCACRPGDLPLSLRGLGPCTPCAALRARRVQSSGRRGTAGKLA